MSPSTDLTPIERSALIVLMAERRPLRDSADLRARYGIDLKPAQRKKLQDLGLIVTTNDPHMTHVLTPQGRAWAEREARCEAPPGRTSLAALYGLLSVLAALAARRGVSLEQLLDEDARLAAKAPGREAGSGETVAQAAWSEADAHLGLALQGMFSLERAFERLRGELGGASAGAVGRAEAASKLVTQWVRQAAHARRIAVTAAPGDEVGYDSVHYDVDDAVEAGSAVRVRTPSVVRGEGRGAVVVARGEAEVLE